MGNATGYSISPSPTAGSTINVGSTLNLPIVLAGGNDIGDGNSVPLTLYIVLSGGLQGQFSSTTPGVTIANNVITVNVGTYAGGNINLTFVPIAACVAGVMTFSHSGGGVGFNAGNDPGPFTWIVSAVVPPSTIPEYVLAWDPPGTGYNVGETIPLQWAVSRTDGGLVPAPATASITVTNPDATTTTISVTSMYANATIPATSILVGAVYQLSQTGTYKAVLSVTLNDGAAPVQIREQSILLQAR